MAHVCSGQATAACTGGASGSWRLYHTAPRANFLGSTRSSGCSRPATSAQERQPRVSTAAAGPATAAAPTTAGSGTAQAADRFGQSDWDSFLRGYASQYIERSYWVDDSMVEGTIPAELEGTLLRNGPGLFEIGGKQIPQPFDGDGMLATFAFKDGKAFFANRYIRTKGFVEEQQARRMLYRGAFSVGNPTGGWLYNPLDLSVKGIANTGVLHWAGKLLALYERDLPYELSTPDLHTKGQTVSVPSEAPYFGAHFRITQSADGQRRLVAFNASEVGEANRINVFEYDDSMNMLHRVEVDLPGGAFGFFHDFLVTEHYYIFSENPMRLDLWKMATKYMLGKACIAECIVYDSSKRTKVHLIPRPGTGGGSGSGGGNSSSSSSSSGGSNAGGRLVFETDPFFSFHHANAYETSSSSGGVAGGGSSGGGGRHLVVLDTVANHEGIDFSMNFETGLEFYDTNEGRGTLTRLVLDTQAGTVRQHRLMDRSCEFPSVAPSVTGKPHTHMYIVGSRFATADTWGAPQAVCKVSVSPDAGVSQPCTKDVVQQDVYHAGPQRFPQEPIFVPRPGAQAEDDGWVLSLVFDGAEERTRLVILNAQDLAAGPVATIKLPHMLPVGLHGSFTSTYLGPQPGEAYPATEYDIRQGVAMEPPRYMQWSEKAAGKH